MKKCVCLIVLLCLFSSIISAKATQQETPYGTLIVPDNITVELISPEHGTLTFHKGPAQLPRGSYRFESWILSKEDESGHTWKLTGHLNTAHKVEIGAEPFRLEIQAEPIKTKLDIYPGDKSMNFKLSLNGPAGEDLRVSGDAPGIKQGDLPQPTFVLYNTDRSFEKFYNFQSQCCGNYRFSWTPPMNVEGPFFVDIQVAGPFKVDFEPKNISEMHQAKILEQQLHHKKQIQLFYLIGCIYFIVLVIVIAALFMLRKPLSSIMQRGEGKVNLKRFTLVLIVFIVFMLLDPLVFLFSGKSDLHQVMFQGGFVAALILLGAICVRFVRKIRAKWPFVTIMLYGIFFVLFVVPVVFSVLLMFGRPDSQMNDIDLSDFGEFYGVLFTFSEMEAFAVWAVILALLAAQVSLLIVPVRIKHQRPRARRGVWWTAIIAGLLYTVLLLFAGLSVFAVIWGDSPNETAFWVLLGVLPLNWISWSVIFGLFSRSTDPESYIRRLMTWLIGGSILELLIAVPSHIIIRHRDVCCAHGLTAAGLTSGLAVIFFAFGPGLYFLYADRIRRKQPNLSAQQQGQAPEPLSQE